MNCQKCYGYINDYLYLGIPPDLAFREYVHLKHLRKVIPILAKGCLQITKRLSPVQYNKAILTANNIARRGRGYTEYFHLIQTAALNFLRIEHDWLKKEIEDLKCYLIEESFIRHKKSYYAMKAADEYICYMLPRLIGLVYTIHRDHITPKGLETDVSDTILSTNILPRPSQTVLYDDDFIEL